MSENDNTEIQPDETTPAEPHGEKPETDWKAEARKWEARAKAAKADSEAAAKWREFEQSQKSDLEKLTEQLASAQAAATEAAAKLTRLEVASEKGIPADAIDLLTGSTREELEFSADKLLSLIANQSKPNTPKPDFNQGKPKSGGGSTADMFAEALNDVL